MVAQWSLPDGDVHSEYGFCSYLICSNVSLYSSLSSVLVATPAPPRDGNEKHDHLERGILKAEVAGREEYFYVGMDRNRDPGFCTLTNDAGRALRFRFESQSNSTLLECVVSAICQFKTGPY